MIPSVILLARPKTTGGGGGGGGAPVSITDQGVLDSTVGTPATAIYELRSNGNVYNQNNSILETWLITGTSGDYEARATLTGGSVLASGSVGTWMALSTSRAWSQTRNPPGTRSSTALIEIRSAATSIVLDSATVTLTAEAILGGGGG